MPVREIDYPNTGGPSGGERGVVNDRVETGATQFGDDWPGLFIRGDDAFALSLDIMTVRKWYEQLPEEVRKGSGVGMAIRGLADYEKLIQEEVVVK